MSRAVCSMSRYLSLLCTSKRVVAVLAFSAGQVPRLPCLACSAMLQLTAKIKSLDFADKGMVVAP